MLQSSPNPLARPRPPNQRHSSALSTISIPSSEPPSAPGSAAPKTVNRTRFSHQPPVSPPTASRLDMVDSPLSRAARMVKNKVPALGEEILRGAGSLVDAWTTEAEAEACGDTSDAATESGTGRQVMTQDWIQQRTRDELEDLLLQADRVIRERERDLGIAASIGKSLLENNVALRARQDAIALGPAKVAPAFAPAVGSPASPSRRSKARKHRAELIEGAPPPSPLKTKFVSHSRASSDSNAPGLRHISSAASFSSAASATSASTPLQFRAPLASVHARPSTASSSTRKRHSTTPSHSSSPARAALALLEQENFRLSEQLHLLEQSAAEGEEEGRKRLARVVRELEGLRKRVRQAEERNGQLEREKEEVVEEERAKELRRRSRIGDVDEVASFADEEEHKPDESTRYEDLGPKAERLGRRMRRALKKLSSDPAVDDDEAADDFFASSDVSSDLEDAIRSAPVLATSWPGASTAGDTLAVDDHDGTTIDSGPTTPTLPSLATVLAAPTSSSSSPAVVGGLPPSSSPSKEESALVLSLLAQIDALRDAQTGFAAERDSLLTRLERAHEEADQLRRELDEVEDGARIGWEGRKGLIGWKDEDQPDGEGGKRKATGNRNMIAHRRRSSLLFDNFSHPLSASTNTATQARIRRGGNVGGIPVSCGSPVKSRTAPVGHGRSLGSELGSEWSGGADDRDGDGEAEEDEDGAGIVPFDSLLRQTASALDAHREGGYAEDELELLYSDDTETRYELKIPPGGTTRAEGLELRQRRKRVDEGDETGTILTTRPLYDEGLSGGEEDEEEYTDDDEEDEDERGSDCEPWEHIESRDSRKHGYRGTDYYPISLRARHAPRMVVQRLHDRWRRWFLVLVQWVQLIVVISFAVGWALSKGPKAVLDGKRKRMRGRQSTAAVPMARRIAQ